MNINTSISRPHALQIASIGLLAATTAVQALQPRPSFSTTTKALAELERLNVQVDSNIESVK